MGYYTEHRLSVVSLKPDARPSEEIISEMLDGDFEAAYSINVDGSTCYPSKWYDHETTLKEFSKKRPDYVFILHGVGEEDDDVWEKDFWNGNMVVRRAKIVMPPFCLAALGVPENK